MSLVTAVEQVAQVIADTTGLHAVSDPSKITVPCVLVNPPDLNFTLMDGAQATFTVLCLAPAPWNLDALTVLSDMLDALLAVDGMVPAETATPGAYQTGKGTEIPCYRVTYHMAINT